MASGRRSPSSRVSALGVAVSNLIPIGGIVVLGWSPDALLGIYVLELGAVCWWTLVKMPFAEKRPNSAAADRFVLLGPLQEKRGATRVPGPLPPVYLRNVPTIAGGVLASAFALFCGFFVFALARPDITVPVVQTMFVGGAAVFLANGIETWAEYFRGGGYRDHSPRSLLLAPFKHLLGVSGLLIVFIALAGANSGDGGVIDPRAVILLLATGKLAYDLRAFRLRREGRRGLFAKLYGSERTEIRPVPVEVPDDEPNLCVTPPRRVAVGDALFHGLAYGFLWRGFVVGPFVALGIVAGAVRITAVALAFGLALAGIRATTRYLRYGTLGYRFYDGVVVAYDRLLGEPQSRLEQRAITDVSVTERVVDRCLGTETVELGAAAGEDEQSVRLFVPDTESINEDDANEDRPLTLVHVPEAGIVTDALEDSARSKGETDA